MKRIFVLLILFLGCCGNIFSQTNNWLWAKSASSIAGSGNEGWAISTDNAGNVFIVGAFNSPTITFGSTILTNAGHANLFIAKYDYNGNVLWAKSFGGALSDEAISVCTDAEGNAFITGEFESPTITFGSTTFTNTGGTDLFIVKFDGSGNVLWANNGTGADEDQGLSVSADAGGNVFVSGYFIGPTVTFASTTLVNAGGLSAHFDIFLCKYDANGNLLWAKSAGGTSEDEGASVSADAEGNVFLTGIFDSPSITFGSTILTNPGFFIAKYDSNGNVLWAKSTIGAGNNNGTYVCADRNGNAFVTGLFTKPTITFSPITLTNANNNNSAEDLFIAKYDANGNVLWAKSAGGMNDEIGFCLSTDTSSNVYLTGKFTSSAITFGSITLPQPIGSVDPMFIVKYDPLGNVLCAAALSSGGDDKNGVSADRFGNAYVGGDFFTNPFIVGSDTLIPTGTEDVFIAKYNCNLDAGVNEIAIQDPISISPNPFSSSTTIQFTTTPKNAELNIYNLYGQEIRSIKNISSNKTDLNRGDLLSGIYFVRLVEGEKLIGVGKIIITD